MKKNFLFLVVLAICICSTTIKAQQNVVKLNLTSLALMNPSLIYERALNENMSVNLHIQYLLPRGLPSLSFASEDTSVQFSSFKMSGISVVPEFRMYLSSEKEAPRGFYIAPYFRYSNYGATSTYAYDEDSCTNRAMLDTKFNISYIGGGLTIGAHWLINDKVSVDWWFVGFGYGTVTSTVRVTGELQCDTYEQVRGSYETEVSDYGNVTTSVGSDFAQVVIKRGLPGVRGGISIGYAF
ncbi:MAG: hypothetical protein COC01_01815 [Bacteroidetes bacterium]|nr:MAG: hypothetical protein COC01_01815 [Bacteroidota bacterium]